jgi:hypothetical protein
MPPNCWRREWRRHNVVILYVSVVKEHICGWVVFTVITGDMVCCPFYS